MNITRFQAFAAHLLASLIIGTSCAALVFLVWYPWPLPVATGVTAIFLLLLSVDVIIGPCITLIVFNPAKKELRRDMAIVVALQVCALLYGMHAVFVARPVYYVFNVDRFDLVFANDLSHDKLEKVTDPRFKTVPLGRPVAVAARSPEDTEARNRVLLGAIVGGDDLPQLPQYYVPYPEMKAQVVRHLRDMEQLRQYNAAQAEDVDALLAKYASRRGRLGFLPLRGKTKDLTVIVEKETAEIVDIVDLRPWPH